VIGDAVNLAARLESSAKQFGVRVQVSDTVAAKVSEVVLLRLMLPLQVVGKELPVRVYELVGVLPNASLSMADAEDDDDASGVPAMGRGDSVSFSAQGGAPVTSLAASGRGHAGASPAAAAAAAAPPPSSSSSSNRRDAHVTAARCLAVARSHAATSIVTTEAEVTFANAYTSAVSQFCNGDATGCLAAMAALREAWPMFFSYVHGESDADVRRVVGERRCAAALMSCGKSASIIEKLAKTAAEAAHSSDAFALHTQSSLFVFKASDK
jgi:hypothetical protein